MVDKDPVIFSPYSSQITILEFRSLNDYNYITLFTGCFATVGRVGRAQRLNLEPNCVQHGTVVHEFVHSIGYFHEQSRPDRDDYVAILQENIQSGKDVMQL